MAKANKHPTPAPASTALTRDAKLTAAFGDAAKLPLIQDASPIEPRALDLIERLEPGHKLVRIDDDRNAPHLRPGEFAVADTNDREFVSGELYLIHLQGRCRGR